MKINLKNIFITLSILLVLIITINASLDMKKREDSIENNKFETVGKVYKFNSNRSFNHYDYIYYYNNEKYSNYDDLDDFKREDCIGNFYKLHLSTENPQYSKIFLDQQVTDTSEIINSGFKLIKNKKSKYNSSTAEYSEFTVVEFE